MKNPGNLHNLYVAIDSLPTLQIPLRIVELFEKIYDGEPILTVFSNIEEDVQYRCFNEGYYVKRMGPAPICLKISARTAKRETYRMIPLSTRLFSHSSIPLSDVRI
jgi:hypothetical protein